MPSKKLPPDPQSIAGGVSSITGTFLADEVMRPHAADRPLVSIILPAYNEAAILREHLIVLLEYLRTLAHRFRFEIIIVNDGSHDQTGEIADRLASEFEGIRVFHHPRNFGLGQALKTGFARFHGQYVIILDIDLSYGPEHVGLLLDRITSTGARIVLASPYMRGGRVLNVPWSRVLLSRAANWFLARASGHRISTSTCMVRAIDGRFLRSLHLRNTGMDVMPEMIQKAKILRASFEEIPAELNWELQNRVSGRRRSSMRILRQIFGTTFSGFMLRPFTFLLVPGLLLLAFAVYVNTWMVIHFISAYAELRTSADLAHSASAAVALAYSEFPHTFIVGLLSLMLAIQLTGMALLSLQSKKYFDELFHLESILLREQRESMQVHVDSAQAMNPDPTGKRDR